MSNLLALGINHRSAAVSMREKVAFSPELIVSALRQSLDGAHLNEAVILSTCNRTEIYGCLDRDDANELIGWMAQYHDIDVAELQRCVYQHWGQAAINHLMRVAVGLDSMVLGEPQILGQLKDAFSAAEQANTVGPLLGRGFRQAFSAAKKVRHETRIGENPVSVAFAAVSLTRHIFADLQKTSALLIGAGETIELVARHLKEQGVQQIWVANRTVERAAGLAEQFDGVPIGLRQISDVLHFADIVISSTASPLPVLGKGAVEQALKLRRHQPVFMMDIAVPRDIEPEVGELADIYLYTVDDLQEVVQDNQKQREIAAEAATTMIEQEARQFMDGLQGLQAVDSIRAFRAQTEALREQEFAKAVTALGKGENPEAVLQRMSRNLTQKMLHTPTVQMRKASEAGAHEQLRWAETLLGIQKSATPKSK